MLEKPLAREQRASDLLRRPELNYAALTAVDGLGPAVTDTGIAEQVEIQAKYSGYLDRQQAEIQRQQHYQDQPLPVDFDYNVVRGLSNEACEKLQAVRPETIGQAARIPGITPAAVSLLLIHMKRHKATRKSA
jgi:tRNA uridine 5-carboxymethylaminomethyl modification enzyme